MTASDKVRSHGVFWSPAGPAISAATWSWQLLDAGEDVVVLDNLSTGFRWAVPDAAKFVEGDVGDAALRRAG